ncbi:hypothetical protein M404DRAFT_31865 [Pisolithus tinctorius Marx 270]|uniref:Uncharacterized protein n=1 Tax=Pisolithus tinctorius Marx 270 TaxID=870435 RepID=A0A0C3NQZ6_PISTI|nr:hypothetical protein M404DRAFT_31865 [Pisolithus tinctorius Marx 270]
MSESRLITATDKNDEGLVIVDWTQVSDDTIQYDTDNEEEVMKAKSKERKRVEREWIEAERAEREKAKAKKAAQEAEERRVCKEEERQEAERKHKAEAGKGDEAGASGSEASEVKKVVMDPGCTCCAQAQVVCEFLMDGNKKQVACVCCNQSKGKCQWPGDRKDSEAGPRVISKADKGKKWKANNGTPEPGPSQRKWAKLKLTEVLEIDEPKAGGSGGSLPTTWQGSSSFMRLWLRTRAA